MRQCLLACCALRLLPARRGCGAGIWLLLTSLLLLAIRLWFLLRLGLSLLRLLGLLGGSRWAIQIHGVGPTACRRCRLLPLLCLHFNSCRRQLRLLLLLLLLLLCWLLRRLLCLLGPFQLLLGLLLNICSSLFHRCSNAGSCRHGASCRRRLHRL